MSDLLKYNLNYSHEGKGLINHGASCYFNSLLQCLLSCTSIGEILIKNKDDKNIKNNKLACLLLDIWSTKSSDINEQSTELYKLIVQISQNQKNNVKMDFGQQDAHEGLMMFLSAMENIPEIYRLFMHRYRTQILCPDCKQYSANIKEINTVFEVQPDLKIEQLDKFKDYNTSVQLGEFLRKQNGYVDKNYICTKCGNKGEKIKITTLTMVPEILPIVIKKYERKINTPFPLELEFLAKGSKKKYLYKLVAQSEHSGSTGGGHYWAICNRRNGCKLLNDSHVSDGTLGPTENTYMIFYHFYKEERVHYSI